jgi:hydroxymethylpyrimidine/phosphomethylpyrimidine kinase
VLVGFPVNDEASMRRAAEKLLSLGAKAVLMKGGHLEGDRVIDLLVHDGQVDRFEDARIASRHTHGTGCTLASATATGLAQKMGLRDAFARARAYVRKAIETAPGYGQGHGPLNHAVTVRSD